MNGRFGRTGFAILPLAVLFLLLSALSALSACGSSHPVPEHPTWVDVEPILRAECLSCHGGSAATTASAGGAAYRFDFYDLTPEVCGEAASALDSVPLAGTSAQLIANAITSVYSSTRPRMPPAPAPSLAEWEWQTILRWTDMPAKGPTPAENRPPVVRLTNIAWSVDKVLGLSAIVEDPDGQAAVGVLIIGGFHLKMDRPGAFVVQVDTSTWPVGAVPVQAIVCDGWSNANYNLGTVTVAHQ